MGTKEEAQISEKLDVLSELEPVLEGTTEPDIQVAEQPAEAAQEEKLEKEIEPESPPEEKPEEQEEAKTEVATEAPPESPPSEEEVDFEAINKSLVGELERLSTQLLQQAVEEPARVPAPKKEAPTAPTPSTRTAAPPEPDIVQFVTDEAYEQALQSPKALNELLNRVHTHTLESSMRVMPDLANRLIAHAFYTQTLRNKFYEENKDLMPHQGYVGYVENEIRAQNPDKPLHELFNEIAKEVRTRLNLDAKRGKTPAALTEEPNPTAISKPTTSRKPVPKKEPLLDEIDEIVNFQPRY